MRAIAIHDFGAAPTVTDLPAAEPGPDEVLVRVQASSVNGFDLAVAAGMLKGMMEHRFPVILGKDFAGTIAAVGAGVSRFAVGDAVFGVVMKPFLGDGAFCELVVVGDEFGIAPIPDGLDMATAGVLGLAGTAAINSVEALNLGSGDTVLVSGATGGVGAFAVQFAGAAGAHVIATARPGAKSEFVRELGAQDVVDHTADLAGQVRAIAPDGVAAVVHAAGDGAELAGLLAPDGRLASTVGFGPDQHPAAIAIMATPDPTTLDWLATFAGSGAVLVPISETYDLADVPDALARFSSGKLGKLAVAVS
jgi:NADPH:quinone reductase-like Zn-dependent oxidoreductase